ncbi:Peptidase, M23/M37 family [Gulosibacter sp. 10]|nr:Peptidase, M23/M37 family [Gulosibacter sp. 10]
MLRRRKLARLCLAGAIVAALAAASGAQLLNPSGAPAAIETVPTAAPEPTLVTGPDAESEAGGLDGQGGRGTHDAALEGAGGSGAPGLAPPGDQLSGAASPPGRSDQLVQWPLTTRDRNITSYFGPRTSPCAGCSSNHRGLDFAGAVGMPVGSIADGVVVDLSAADRGGLGVHVVIEHRIDGKITHSVYGHLHTGSITVSVGERVQAGERIGSLGNTGASTGPHLHLEIIIQGTHVDPLSFLRKYADGHDVDIIDRPPVDWAKDQDPDAEGEGWQPDEDTLDVDPDEHGNPSPSPTPTPDPSETPAPGEDPGPTDGPGETDSPEETDGPGESPQPTPTGGPEEPGESEGPGSGPGEETCEDEAGADEPGDETQDPDSTCPPDAEEPAPTKP